MPVREPSIQETQASNDAANAYYDEMDGIKKEEEGNQAKYVEDLHPSLGSRSIFDIYTLAGIIKLYDIL